jgi:hypothetical protein
MIEKLILTFLIFIPVLSHATTYYIKAGGNDAAIGTSDATAWATITKVNSFWSAGTFAPGDRILFNRGDVFYGTITVKESGTSGSPIVIGAYGTGNKPVIEGFTTISSWTNEGNNIYSAPLACESSTYMVLIDGTQYWMGRWPKTGWMYIDGTPSSQSIIDNELSGTLNWTGAEVVIRKDHWIIDRHPITNHINNRLDFSSSSYYPPQVGWGYFIQNSLNTLTDFGDWYYNASTSRLYMYFGSDSPENHLVRASTLNRCLYNNSYDYITIDNITFQGANEKTIYGCYSPEYMIIQNCNILFSGIDAIYLSYPHHCELRNSTINYTNNNAVYFSDNESFNNTISNNIITNTATIAGAGGSSDGTYNAIISTGSNGLIEYNKVITTGYLPIRYGGANTIVRNNYVDYYAYLKDDGGGIYIYSDNNTGKQVLNNIILNAIGAPSGTNVATSQANGLYVDGFSSHVLLSGNTVYNATNIGLHMNCSADIEVINNTIFQTPTFYSIQRWPQTGFITDLNISKNILVSTRNSSSWKSPIAYNIDMNGSDLAFYNNNLIQEVKHLGYIDSNYYYSNTTNGMYLNSSSPHSFSSQYTFDSWISTFGYDSHSNISTHILDEKDYLFVYNPSRKDSIITLEVPMIDVKGTKFATEITLAPFTSSVLLKESDYGNNLPPSIIDQSFQIDKNRPNGTVVGTVLASDPDADQILNYSIVSGNNNNILSLNSTTGELTLVNGEAISSDFVLIVKVQDNGIGNLSSLANITINVNTVGIEPIGSNSIIKVYPNPFSDELIIDLEGNSDKLDLEILNSSGFSIFRGKMSERTVIPATNFSPGIYFIKLKRDKIFEFTKIIKL